MTVVALCMVTAATAIPLKQIIVYCLIFIVDSYFPGQCIYFQFVVPYIYIPIINKQYKWQLMHLIEMFCQ